MTDIIDKLVAALDQQRPDWWLAYASEQDANDFMRLLRDIVRLDQCNDPALANELNRAKRMIDSRKSSIANDLTFVINAALAAGLVQPSDTAA